MRTLIVPLDMVGVGIEERVGETWREEKRVGGEGGLPLKREDTGHV